VLSPNLDGVAEQQSLAYKLVRPSTVEAKLVAPNGTTRPIDAGQRAAGIYRFSWDGRIVGNRTASEVEGRWRFTVAATDTDGQTSTADRYFSVNNTLQGLNVSPALVRLRGGGLRASFVVQRTAKVTITIETASGIVLRVLARSRTLAPGPHRFSWDGRDGSGRLVAGGRLEAHVAATNGLGRVDLRGAFRARR
jgi:flagellar hook assembly protein FlgD